MNIICELIYPQGEITPLHRAAQHNHVAVIETLITSGADVHAVDKVCSYNIHKLITGGRSISCYCSLIGLHYMLLFKMVMFWQ